MSEIETIAASVYDLATPGMEPKELIAAVQERYPEASKKQITRAAFYAVIAHSNDDPEKLSRLHAMAMAERGANNSGVADHGKQKNKKKDGKTARH